DVLRRAAGALEAALRRFLDQSQSVLDEERVPLGPAVRLQVPLDGHAGMAAVDAGIAEGRQQPLDLREIATEQLRCQTDHFALVEAIGRDRGGDGGDPGHYVLPQGRRTGVEGRGGWETSRLARVIAADATGIHGPAGG